MTFREIARLAFGIGTPYYTPPPDTETYAPPPLPPTPEEVTALIVRAKAGEATAQRELGIMYYRGRSVLTDRAEAFKWLTLALRQGDAQAEKFFEMLGPTLSAEDAYEGRRRIAEITGEPLPPPPGSEWQLIDDAAAAKGVDAATAVPEFINPIQYAEALGWRLGESPAGGVPQVGEVPRPQIMLEPVPVGRRGWIVALAACVVIGAVAIVGYIYVVRDAGTKIKAVAVSHASDDAAAEKLTDDDLARLRKAAEAGDAKARVELGDAFAQGNGVARDLATAIEWYRKAAAAGDAAGKVRLAEAYERGRGVAADLVTAAQWYRQAAEQNNALAQFRFGFMCERGTGVKQDYAEAARWYRQAADHGQLAARNNLGVLYINGTGVPRDLVQAYKWLHLASKRDFPGAVKNREQLSLFMKAEEIADALKQASLMMTNAAARP
ncbi:MAG TPA: SEL1-like repeat protein [Verrucomicrobiae bacterium]|jgi:TPR repeat protein